MKKILFIDSGILVVVALLVGLSANASSTATVTATVTVQNISLTVASGSIAWGTLAVGSATSSYPSKSQTVTNAGNVAEDFLIKGTDSTNWTLATSPATDKYSQSACSTSCTSAPTGFTALATSSNITLSTNVSSSGTANLDLYIQTPTVSSVYTQQSVDVTLTAIAH